MFRQLGLLPVLALFYFGEDDSFLAKVHNTDFYFLFKAAIFDCALYAFNDCVKNAEFDCYLTQFNANDDLDKVDSF